ncbi:MAG: type II secretion system protein [Fimbriimonadaceae bacterium]|nr:type II secretion system protein [Fimbriimonadaceae bacterium]
MNRAFSFIELLVTIAIVAILVALTFPAFNEVRRESYRGVATSVLRQAGMAVKLYQSDHDDEYPRSKLDGLVTGGYLTGRDFLLLPGDPHPDGFGNHISNCEGPKQTSFTQVRTSIEHLFGFDGAGKRFLDHMVRPHDPNPGILIARIYGDRDTQSACSSLEFTGKLLRLREDGSVERGYYREWTREGAQAVCIPALFTTVPGRTICGEF